MVNSRSALAVVATLALAACPAPAPAGSAAEPTGPARRAGDPHASRDELVKATLAAMSTGDLAAFDKLVDLEAMTARATECKTPQEHREDLAHKRTRFNELRVSLDAAAVTLIGVDDDKTALRLAKGQPAGKGCTTKVPLEFHTLQVAVDVTHRGAKAEPATAQLTAIAVDGVWYLAAAPELKLPTSDAGVTEKFRLYRDKICACKDQMCLSKVQDDMAKAFAEVDQTRKPSEEDMAIAQQMAQCMAKLAGDAAPPP